MVQVAPDLLLNGLITGCISKNMKRTFLLFLVWGWIGVWEGYGQTNLDWRSESTNGNWNDANNWWNGSGTQTPPGGERLRFNNNVQTNMTNDATNGNRFQIIFQNAATTGRNISGSNNNTFFEFGGTWPRIENQSTTLHTINFPFTASSNSGFNLELVASNGNMDFGSSATINNNGRIIQVYGNNLAVDGTNRAIRLGGVVSGTGALNVSQFGVAKLNANHTYNGNTEIDNGELWVESAGSIATGSSIFVGNGGQLANTAKLWLSNSTGGTTFSNDFTLNNGNLTTREIGGLNTSGTHTFSGNITNISNTGGLLLSTINAGGTVNYSGILSGGGAYTVQGPGTTILSGSSANTYTGVSAVNGGTLVLNKTANTIAIPTSLTVATGVTVRTDAANQWGTGTPPLVTINGTGSLNLNNTNQKIALASASSTSLVTLGSGTLNIDNTGTDTYAGTITGSGGITKTNTGTQILSNTANSYSGTTTITGGTLRLGSGGVIPDASNVVLDGGNISTGAAAGFSETVGTLNLNANSTIAMGTGVHTITFAASNAVSWAGNLLTITGWTGPNNGVGAGTAGRIFIGNTANGLTPSQLSRVIFNISSTMYSAVQLSTGEIVASGAIPLYYGGATAAWNTANWSTNNAAPYSANWADGRHAIFNIASTNLTGASVNFPYLTANENVTITATGSTIGFAGQTSRIFVASGRTMDFSTNPFSTSATFGIVKNGPGILALAGNTYGGGFTLNDGLVVARGVNALGGNATPGPLNINGGSIGANATRDYSTKYSVINVGGDFTLGSATSPASITANLTFDANIAFGSSVTRTITLGGTGTYALNGIISGTSSNLVLSATAAGTLSLGGVNSYGGNTTINGGTMQLTTGSDRLPTTTGLIFGNISGAILNLNGQNQTVVSLSGGGTTGGNIALGAGILTVNGTPNTTYSGVISGTGALVKSGTGILTLENSANSFTGTTTINSTSELRLNPVANATYASQIKLNSGKLSTTGIATNLTWTSSSTLSLDASSTIDLGSNIHTISFANSSGVTWTGSTTLTINGWAGTAENPGTAGRIFFGNSNSSLTAAQLSQITFTGYAGTPILLASGELVPGVGVTFTWNGSVSFDWGTAANWTPSSGSGTPGSNDLVVIPGTIGYTIALNITGNRTCNSFTVSSDGAFSTSPGSTLTVTGNFVYASSSSSTFDCASTLNLTSPFSQNVPALNFGNLNLAGGPRVLASSGTIGICGNYTPSVSTTTITGSTISFNGSGVQVVPNTHSYSSLNIANSNAGYATFAGNTTVTSNLTINNGFKLDIGNNTLILTGATAIINGTLRSSGAMTGGTNFFGATGVYEHNFSNAVGQIPIASWNNGSTVRIIGYNSNSFAGPLTTAAGFAQTFSNFEWNNPNQTATINWEMNNHLPSISGNFLMVNTGTAADGLRLASSSTVNLNINGNYLQTGGTLDLSNGATVNVNISGGLDITGGILSRNSGTGTVNFAGTSNQNINILNASYISGQVSFRLNNAAGITIPNGSTLPINANATFYRRNGAVSLSGSGNISYVTPSSILEYEPQGSTSLTTSSAEWPDAGHNRVRINSTSSNAISLHAGRVITSGGSIDFVAGRLALGNFNLTIQNNAENAVTQSSGYAETDGSGQLIRTILSSNNKTYLYPIGNGSNYTPVSYLFSTNSLAGRQLGVRSLAFIHPNMSPNPTDYLNNRYWVTTLSDAGGSYSYIPTFTYVNGDISGTAGNVRLSRWNGSVWSTINASSADATTMITTIALTQITGNLANAEWSGRNIKLPVDYTWNFGGSGSWTTNTNWTPNGIPTSEDIVRFTHAGNYTVSNVPTGITLRNLLVSGTGITTLTTTSAGTLSLFGGTNPVFSVGNGSTLIVSGTQTLNTVILTGGTGTVAGNVQLRAEGSVVSHTLEASDAGGLIFSNGSNFTAGSTSNSNYSGNPFGNTGTTNTVVFADGSNFIQYDGANPFGLSQPNSKVSFSSSSNYRYADNSSSPLVLPSISGRTYGNFIFSSSQTRNPEGGTATWNMNNLSVESGTFGINLQATGNITGNISVTGGGLDFTPSSGNSNINLNGSLLQNISGAGNLSIGTNATLTIANNTGVSLQKNITVNGTLNIAANAIFNATATNVVSGTGIFNLQTDGFLGVGSPDGLFGSTSSGNIQTTNRTVSSGASVRYNGTGVQTTGNFSTTPTTNTLKAIYINNPAGVSLSSNNNNITLSALTLETGAFSIGSGQQVNLASGGTVNGSGGDFANGANGGTLNFTGSGSFSGSCNPYNVYTSGGVNFGNGMVTIQDGGAFRINAGGFANTNGPFYGAGSTLQYNTGGSFTAGTEWYAFFNSGRGVPHHVQIGVEGFSNSSVSFGTSTAWRHASGNITIGHSGTGSGYNFSLATNVGGDVRLEGNWIRHANGTFTPNNRSVTFAGNGNTQTITRIGGGTETFAYFIVNKPNGDVQLTGAAHETDVVVNGNAGGNNLQLLGGNIDLNGETFEWGGTGNLQTDSDLRLIYSASPATFLVTGGNRAVQSTNGGTLEFDDQTTVIISAGLDFASNTTTINASLQINSGGFANVNAPIYGPNGRLVYNTGGSYLRRVEWNGNVENGPGYPNDVVLQNSTTLWASGSGGENAGTLLSAERDVLIGPGSELRMDGTHDMLVPLVAGRNLTIEGILAASDNANGNVFVGQNWYRGNSGNFIHNNRAVFFNTSQVASIGNAGINDIETFPYVIVDKAGTADNTLTLAAPVEISGKFTLSSGRVITDGNNVLTIINDEPDNSSNGVGYPDNNTGYVDGPMRRNVRVITGADADTSYLFPVGDYVSSIHYYRRFRLKNIDVADNTFTGEFFKSQPPGAFDGSDFFGNDIIGIHRTEYWEVEKELANLTTARLVVPYVNPGNSGWLTIDGSPTQPATDPKVNVAIVHSPVPDNWEYAGDGNGFDADPSMVEPEARPYNIDGELKSRVVSKFSPFSIGFGYASILPLHLLTFTAALHGPDALLHFTLADAKDLKQFEVEHSTDGQRFQRLATIGYNGGADYHYRHANLPAGVHYYRLKMVEKDGSSSYSKVEVLMVNTNQTLITGLMHNPIQGGQAVVKLFSASNQDADVRLIDMAGRTLLRQKLLLQTGYNQPSISLMLLPAGMYKMLISTRDGVEKVMTAVK